MMLIRPLHPLARKIWNFWLWKFLPYSSYVRSLVRSPVQAVFSWPDPAVSPKIVTLGPRVVLFVHFDSGGDVRPYVAHYVRQLNETGLSVVFVSNAGRLRPPPNESTIP